MNAKTLTRIEPRAGRLFRPDRVVWLTTDEVEDIVAFHEVRAAVLAREDGFQEGVRVGLLAGAAVGLIVMCVVVILVG